MIQRAERVAARHQLENHAEFQQLIRADGVVYPRRDTVATLPAVQFSREIESPFRRTRFFLFIETWIEPNWGDVVCSFQDTLTMLPVDTSKWEYVDEKTLAFLNNRLADEPALGAAQVVDLFQFYNDLRDLDNGFQVTLHSWRDIVWEENTQAPSQIKDLIHEPQARNEGGRYLVTGYVWDMGSTELRKVTLTYAGRHMSMEVIIVGRYGAHHILI